MILPIMYISRYLKHRKFYVRLLNIVFLFALTFTNKIYAQEYFKITADITVKERFSENQFSLIKGSIEYNKFTDKTVLNFTFPEKEKIILTKDSITRIYKGKITYRVKANPIYEYSIFRLFLNGNLKNYGLQKSLYKITDINKKENGSIYTT